MVIDQTAAFGMVDHQILLSRLSDRFLVAGVVLESPYFIKREQRVCSQTRPRIHHPCHGLSYYPKRQSFARSFSSATRHQFMASFMHLISILSAYTVRIQDIMHAHLIPTMIYTDDTPLYISKKSSDRDPVMKNHQSKTTRLSSYIPRRLWLMMNWLLLVVPQPFGTRSQTQNYSVNNLKHIFFKGWYMKATFSSY